MSNTGGNRVACSKCGADLTNSFANRCWLCGEPAPSVADQPPVLVAELVVEPQHDKIQTYVLLAVVGAAVLIAAGLAFIDLSWFIVFTLIAAPAILLTAVSRQPSFRPTVYQPGGAPPRRVGESGHPGGALRRSPSTPRATVTSILAVVGSLLMYGAVVVGLIGMILLAAVIALISVCLYAGGSGGFHP